MTIRTRTNPAITNRDREQARITGRRVVVAIAAMRRANAALITVLDELRETWPDAYDPLSDYVFDETSEPDPTPDPRIDAKRYDEAAAKLLEIIAAARTPAKAKASA